MILTGIKWTLTSIKLSFHDLNRHKRTPMRLAIIKLSLRDFNRYNMDRHNNGHFMALTGIKLIFHDVNRHKIDISWH